MNDYWIKRWEDGCTGWQLSEAHHALVEHIKSIAPPGSTILVPLCGKTSDMRWLAEQGYNVIGIELSGLAIEQFFGSETPSVETAGRFKVHKDKHQPISIFRGDIFDLTSSQIGPIGAVFDRAALVALPPGCVREKYIQLIVKVTGRAPQLVVTFNTNEEMDHLILYQLI